MNPNSRCPLSGRRILLVEDDYFIANELQEELKKLGAAILGPVATVAEALEVLAAHQDADGAILDVNLGGEMVFPVVDALRRRNVPVVLATGYDESMIPERYADLPRFEKPARTDRIVRALRIA